MWMYVDVTMNHAFMLGYVMYGHMAIVYSSETTIAKPLLAKSSDKTIHTTPDTPIPPDTRRVLVRPLGV